MEVVTILTIMGLNIILPTADVYSDIILVVKLYKPPPGCKFYISHYNGDRLEGIYRECKEDPVKFCSKDENREHCVFSHPKMAIVLLMPSLHSKRLCCQLVAQVFSSCVFTLNASSQASKLL